MSRAMSSAVTDPPSSPAFVAAEWIGCGRKFPSPTPFHLLAALRAVLKIPDVPSFDIPHSTESIPMLVGQDLPALDSTKAAFPIFLSTDPEIDELSYNVLKVPSMGIITQLSAGVKQAWLDGKKSLLLPHISPKRLPLWIINYWYHIHPAIHTAVAWRRAFSWCTSIDSTIRDAVDDTLVVVGWKAPIPWALPWKGGVETNSLACLLGTEWVNDSTVGAMLAVIQNDLDLFQPERKAQVLPIHFARHLFASDSAFFNSYSQKRAPYEYHIGEKLANGEWSVLYYVLHVSGSHWIAVSLDIPSKRILYGDSLNWKFPDDHREGIQLWLSKHGLGPFQVGILPHASQDDSFSCGIVSANTIEHSLLSKPLWTAKEKDSIRIEWYHRIMDKARMIQVRIPEHRLVCTH